MFIFQNHIRAVLPIVIKTTANQTNTKSMVQTMIFLKTHTHNSWAEPMFPVDLLRVSSVDENISARFFCSLSD